MMYSNKLAVAVKVNGKVLRDTKDTAYIPFGSEYTLLIKNLNTVRVEVCVEIDGTSATEGHSLIIMPNSEMELKRFINNGNLNEGNAFKFIERTAGIEKHRGIGIEDGLVRIEYQFELPVFNTAWIQTSGSQIYPQAWIQTSGSQIYPQGGIMRGFSNSTSDVWPAGSVTCSAASYSTNDVGITVPGQVVDQKFSTTERFPVEKTKHVMVIKLLGKTETSQVVQKPVTVKAKPRCTTCGHVNKATAKFCSECGTSLVIM